MSLSSNISKISSKISSKINSNISKLSSHKYKNIIIIALIIIIIVILYLIITTFFTNKNSNKEPFADVPITINNTTYYIFSPPVNNTGTNYSRSSTYTLSNDEKKQKPDYDPTASNIDSSDAWYIESSDGPKIKSDNKTIYLQFNLDAPTSISGVITQSRGYRRAEGQMVTKYKVQYSTVKDFSSNVINVDGDKEFPGNTKPLDKVSNLFSQPITAQYIRIYPTGYSQHPSMRVGLLTTSVTSTTSATSTTPSSTNQAVKNTKDIIFNTPVNKDYSILNPPENMRQVSSHWDLNNPICRDPPNSPVPTNYLSPGNSFKGYPSKGYYDAQEPIKCYPASINPPGYDHLSSMLDKLEGWSSFNNSAIDSNSANKEWVEMDLGSTISVEGVVTQGRGPGLTRDLNDMFIFTGQSVTSYTVQSSNDRTNWTPVDNNKVFSGNTPGAGSYINIEGNWKKVQSFNSGISISQIYFDDHNMSLVGIGTDTTIYYSNENITKAPIWKQIYAGTNMKYIAYSNNQIFGVIPNEGLYYNSDCSNNNWKKVQTWGANQIPDQICFDGYTMSLAIIGFNKRIYYTNVKDIKTNILDSNWKMVDANWQLIYAGINISYIALSNNQIFGIIRGEGLYYNSNCTNENWKKVQTWPGNDAPSQLCFDGYNMSLVCVAADKRILYTDTKITNIRNTITNDHWKPIYGGQNITSIAYSVKQIRGNTKVYGLVPGVGLWYNSGPTSNTKIGNVFTSPILARYIRIYPQSYYGHTTMRVGLLTELPNLSNATKIIINNKNVNDPLGNYLQIAYVEVYAIIDGKEQNIEQNPNFTVTSTSIAQNSKAINAVRGQPGTRNYDNTTDNPLNIFCSANNSNNETWTLTFDKPYNVSKIVYYNREECCQGRAFGSDVEVYNNSSVTTPVYKYTLNSDLIQTINTITKNLFPITSQTTSPQTTSSQTTTSFNNTIYYILSPPVNDTNYTRSSTYFLTESQKNNDKFDSTASNIDSTDGWYIESHDNPKIKSDNTTIYLQFNLNAPTSIAGIVTQSRGYLGFPGGINQMVTKYKVQYSTVKDFTSNVTKVDSDKEFTGNTTPKDKVSNLFSQPITAQYIRIYPTGYINHTSMRVGLLVLNPTNTITTTTSPQTTMFATTPSTWRYAYSSSNSMNTGQLVLPSTINTIINSSTKITDLEEIDNKIKSGFDTQGKFFLNTNNTIKYYIDLTNKNYIKNGTDTNYDIYILSYTIPDPSKVRHIRIMTHKPDAVVQISGLSVYAKTYDGKKADISTNGIVVPSSSSQIVTEAMDGLNGNKNNNNAYYRSSSSTFKNGVYTNMYWNLDLIDDYDLETITYYNRLNIKDTANSNTGDNAKNTTLHLLNYKGEFLSSYKLTTEYTQIITVNKNILFTPSDINNYTNPIFTSKNKIYGCFLTKKELKICNVIKTSTTQPNLVTTTSANLVTSTTIASPFTTVDNSNQCKTIVYTNNNENNKFVIYDKKNILIYDDNLNLIKEINYQTVNEDTSVEGFTTTCPAGSEIVIDESGNGFDGTCVESTTTTSGSTSTTSGSTSTTSGSTSTTSGSTSTTSGSTSTTSGSTPTTMPSTTRAVVNDIHSQFPHMSQDMILALINSGVDILSLLSKNHTVTDKGIKLNSDYRSPSTNIYQRNFTGTSNVYSPYLYYNKGSNENRVSTPHTVDSSRNSNTTMPQTTMPYTTSPQTTQGTTSTAGSTTSTAGSTTSTAGSTTSTAGATTSTAGATTSTAGATTSTAGATTSTAGATTSTAGSATST